MPTGCCCDCCTWNNKLAARNKRSGRKLVVNGKSHKTTGGLTIADLVTNKNDKVVSKKKSEQGKKNLWPRAVAVSRLKLQLSGWVAIKKGTPLYELVVKFYKAWKYKRELMHGFHQWLRRLGSDASFCPCKACVKYRLRGASFSTAEQKEWKDLLLSLAKVADQNRCWIPARCFEDKSFVVATAGMTARWLEDDSTSTQL